MDMGFEETTKTGASSSVNVRVLKQYEAEMMMMLPSHSRFGFSLLMGRSWTGCMIQSDRSPTRCHFERRKNGWMLTVLLVVVECPALYEVIF